MRGAAVIDHPWVTGHRDGATYDARADYDRLNKQARDVFRVIANGEWVTLADIAEATGHPEASISARLRDLRKPKFGGHVIERMRLGGGLHAYRWGGRQ